MKIVIQPEISIEIGDIVVMSVRDNFLEKKIIARVHGIPKSIVLWGPDEYDSPEAQTWTNDSAIVRILEKLALPNIPFE